MDLHDLCDSNVYRSKSNPKGCYIKLLWQQNIDRNSCNLTLSSTVCGRLTDTVYFLHYCWRQVTRSWSTVIACHAAGCCRKNMMLLSHPSWQPMIFILIPDNINIKILLWQTFLNKESVSYWLWFYWSCTNLPFADTANRLGNSCLNVNTPQNLPDVSDVKYC